MATAPGVSAAVRNLGYKSQISLPLLRDGAAIGAVSATSRKIPNYQYVVTGWFESARCGMK
jgi:hypothetical protein